MNFGGFNISGHFGVFTELVVILRCIIILVIPSSNIVYVTFSTVKFRSWSASCQRSCRTGTVRKGHRHPLMGSVSVGMGRLLWAVFLACCLSVFRMFRYVVSCICYGIYVGWGGKAVLHGNIITDNMMMLTRFVLCINKSLFRWLNRRSQKSSFIRERFNDLIKQYRLASPRIYVSIYGE